MKELLHRATETLQWKKYGLTLLIVAAGVALMLLPGKSEAADEKQMMQNTEEFSLEATQARINQANAELDKLIGTRTRSIQRKLRGVTSLGDREAAQMLELAEMPDTRTSPIDDEM